MKRIKKIFPVDTLKAIFLFLWGIRYFFVALILLGLGLGIWSGKIHFPSVGSDSPLANTNTPYEELDPESPNYWQERLEIDISEAEKNENPFVRTVELSNNISRTIMETNRIESGNPRNAVLEELANTLIDQDIFSNFEEILSELDTTYRGKAVRARILSRAAVKYLQTGNMTEAESVLRAYRGALGDSNLVLDTEADHKALTEAVNLALILNERTEAIEILKRARNSAINVYDMEKNGRLLRRIAREQAKLHLFLDAWETISRIQNPKEQSEAFGEFVKIYAYIHDTNFIGDGGISGNVPAGIYSPASVESLVHRIFRFVSDFRTERRKRLVSDGLASSEIMLSDSAIYELFRKAVENDETLSEHRRSRMLDLLENPRNNAIRLALGMSPLSEEEQAALLAIDYPDLVPSDPEMLHRKKILQNIQLNCNIVRELLNWGMREESRPLMLEAFEMSKLLTSKESREAVIRTIATQMISVGDFESAGKTLEYAIDTVISEPELELREPILFDMISLQIRARMLPVAEKNLLRMESGILQSELASRLLEEQLRIDRYSEPLKAIANDTFDKIVQKRAALLEEVETLQESRNEPNRDAHLENLFSKLLNAEMLWEAEELLSELSNANSREDHLSRIVGAWVLIGHPYVGSGEFQTEIRSEIRKKAFSLSRKIEDPTKKVAAQLGILAELRERSSENIGKEAEEVLSNIAKVENLQTRAEFLVRNCEISTAVSVKTINTTLETIRSVSGVSEHAALLARIGPVLKRFDRKAEIRSVKNELENLLSKLESPRERVTIRIAIAELEYYLDERAAAQEMFKLSGHEARGLERHTAGERNLELLRKRRDTALDEIARSQAGLGLVTDSMKTAAQIREPLIRDRFFRALAYRFMYYGYLDDAARTARLIHSGSFRSAVMLDILSLQNVLEEYDETEQPAASVNFINH